MITTQPKLALQGVSKAFGSKIVLDGIDLTVAKGESVVIIGGSGSGKSVTLKCILGLLNPDSGSIKVDGEELVGSSRRDLRRIRGKFGMLFQGAALFDSLSVIDNVAFGLIEGRNMARDEARDIALTKLAGGRARP